MIDKFNFIKSQGNPIKILAVDDQPVNLKVISGFCDAGEYKLDTAISGKKAIKLFQKNKYDIILMDVQMPKMDGMATTKAIKHLANYKETPIIALTADAYPETRIKVLKSGMFDILVKPFSFIQLNEYIKKYVIQKHPPKNENSVYNEVHALKQTDRDNKLANDILKLCINSLPEQKLAIENAITTKNLEEIHFYAHKVCSAVCYCTIPKLENIAKQTETLARDNDKQTLEYAKELVTVINEVLDN